MLNLIHLNGKGKVERCFRTVKDGFFNTLDWNTITSIQQLQELYTEYLNTEYINKSHSAINNTPRERFMQDYENIVRKTDEQIEECFLHKATRNVRNDATISFSNMIYEVPQEYIKKYITIKYSPDNLETLYIYSDKNERLHTVKAIDKISNSKVKRADNINLYREGRK